MKVSIITPSYNQGQFIERTLQSVAEQRSTNYELEHVVFDGGSSDNTVEILEQFTPPVRWVSRSDKGQTNAVNMGIFATDGEIIGWLNSDDIYYPGAVSKAVKYFIQHPDVDVVYGKADHIDIHDIAFEEYPSEPWDFERLKETCFICQPALFFRRRVVEENGSLNESLDFCMDYDYWLRLGKAKTKFLYIEERLAGSRLYADNKTLGSRVKVHREINDVFRRLFGVVPDRWLFNYAHVAVDQWNLDKLKFLRVWTISILSVYAAIFWNKKISKKMISQIRLWL